MAGMKRYGVPIIGISVVALTAFTVVRVRNVQRGFSPATDRTVQPLVATSIRAEGRVVTYPDAMVEVRSEISGRVVLLRVQEQQRVRRGDVIAEIAANEARAAMAEAEAQIAAADVDTAWLTTELQRTATLVQAGSMSRQILDRTTHDLAAARARRAIAQATRSRLNAILEKTRIVAPIDGTIISRTVELGEVVAPGTRLVTIADLHRRRVEAEVDEYDAGQVHSGSPVTITAEGYGTQAWEGTVESIPDVIVPRQLKPQDPGRFSDIRVLLVKVMLPQNTPLKLGQRVELAFKSR